MFFPVRFLVRMFQETEVTQLNSMIAYVLEPAMRSRPYRGEPLISLSHSRHSQTYVWCKHARAGNLSQRRRAPAVPAKNLTGLHERKVAGVTQTFLWTGSLKYALRGFHHTLRLARRRARNFTST